MRGHIQAAGLRVNNNTKPATEARLRSFLRRVGIMALEVSAALGTDLAGNLRLNSGLPLWTPQAVILGPDIRFTPENDWPNKGSTLVAGR
jgi:hypothetical protein